MKKSIKIFLILALLMGLFYLSFIPEFKKSKVIDHTYVYIDKGDFLKEQYFVKYGEEIPVDINNDEFIIFLPYSYYYKTEWGYTDYIDQGVELMESYIKKTRRPIFSRYKEGEDYSIQVLRFKILKGNKGNIVFSSEVMDAKSEGQAREIIVNIESEIKK